MNPEVKEKWVAALRSGEYKQARGALKDKDNAYCCLGVLCDISGLGEWKGEEYHIDLGEDGQDVSGGILGKAIQDWSGVEAHGNYDAPGSGKWLARDNDIHGKTFLEIADIIEANF